MLELLNLNMNIMLVLAILILTAVLFLSNAVRVDVAAVLVMVALGLFKLLPPDQLFTGFSSDAVISLIAIMIISAGLDGTGITVRLTKWLLRFGGDSPRKIVVLLMTAAALSASFMRSTGTVALFMPIVNRLHTRVGIDRSYFLLPMAFAAVLAQDDAASTGDTHHTPGRQKVQARGDIGRFLPGEGAAGFLSFPGLFEHLPLRNPIGADTGAERLHLGAQAVEFRFEHGRALV